MSTDEQVLVCVECDHDLERCDFCEEEDCKKAVCFECLRVALGETMSHPHRHGG